MPAGKYASESSTDLGKIKATLSQKLSQLSFKTYLDIFLSFKMLQLFLCLWYFSRFSDNPDKFMNYD